MSIDLNKTYKTRDGKSVRIYCVNAGGTYPVHGAVLEIDKKKWCMESWTPEGNYDEDDERPANPYDLIEVNPLDDLKVDDKVIVRIKKTGESNNYHFAGISAEGVPKLYTGQRTSWTASTTFSIDLDKEELIIP
jgi:hypothetical protein